MKGPVMQFGPYGEHPVAAMFPLLRDVDRDGWSILVNDIRDDGLIDPIVLDGDLILDGRNRYLACELVDVEPRFVQFADLGLDIEPHEYAYQRNMSRRQLTADQRLAIITAFRNFDPDAVKRLKAAAGKLGGRGHKKNLEAEPSHGLQARKRAPQTRAKLAKEANVSEHKAQQAINVAKASPDLLREVQLGKVTLSEAAHRVGLDQVLSGARRPRQRQPAFTDKKLDALLRSVQQWFDGAPPAMRDKLVRRLDELCERVTP